MQPLTWAEVLEIVDISLELDTSNSNIVKEIRMRTGTDLISGVHSLLVLLAISDHPKAMERYEMMRQYFSRLNNAPPWSEARLKHKKNIALGGRF